MCGPCQVAGVVSGPQQPVPWTAEYGMGLGLPARKTGSKFRQKTRKLLKTFLKHMNIKGQNDKTKTKVTSFINTWVRG